MESNICMLAIGFLAQAFFSARILVQWILSERSKKVLSPSLFWILSLAGAYLLCLYGWMRNDFAIVLGQFVSYYVYLWNLKIKGIWARVPNVFRFLLSITPVVAVIMVAGNAHEFADRFLHNEEVPMWLIVYGSFGQILFTLRFVYQWFYCHKLQRSELPAGFWIISLAGALAIVSYAIIRLDPVLIIGQSFGIVAYSRNLFIGKKQKKDIQ
ncbi:MAG: lipid-A-disaccharide synthase N-terminal domain-containing protein [Prevotella sp.]